MGNRVIRNFDICCTGSLVHVYPAASELLQKLWQHVPTLEFLQAFGFDIVPKPVCYLVRIPASTQP